jgi:UDP-2,3-diacylglucosamine pyrophosphatase LpxH
MDSAEEIRANNAKVGIAENTLKLMVGDLKRVAVGLEGCVRRDDYRAMGHYPSCWINQIFGTHLEFLRSAGLKPGRVTEKLNAHRARLISEESIQKYIGKHIMPYVGKYERKSRGRVKHMLIGSDFHGRHVSRFALSVFVDVARRVQPDVIVLNGDVVDFVDVSTWSKDPGSLLSLQDEIDFVNKYILSELRDACPKSQIDWVIGNHEYRLVRYLSDTAPGLASLRCLQFENLLGVKEYKINLVFGSNFLAPTERHQVEKTSKTWKVYYETYVVTHGSHGGKYYAEKELARFGMSGTSGHIHKPQLHSSPTLLNEHADWMSTGMMCEHAAGDGYVVGPSTWTIGFGFATIFPSKHVSLQQPVIIKSGVAEFGGVVYFEEDL